MRFMKIALFVVAALVLSPYAFAGKNDDPNCKCKPGDNSPKCHILRERQGQGQGQAQGQNQGQVATGGNGYAQGGSVEGSGNSANRNSNYSASNASGGSVGDTSATNSISTTGDTRNINDSGNMQFIPSVVPETPPTSLPASEISTTVTACHGLTQVVSTKVVGKYMGFFKTKDIDLGTTDTLVPYVVNGEQQYYYSQKQANGSTKLWGVQSIIQSAVLNITGGRNIALGGGSGSGNWGQGGLGSSSGMQQIVTHIQQIPCEIGTLQTQSIVISKRING